LNGTFGKLKAPELSVVVERSYWLTGLCMVTVAPTTTAPEGSVTVPAMLAEFPFWALPAGAAASAPNNKNKAARNALTDLISESPFMNGGLCATQRRPRMNCEMNIDFDACRDEHGKR
jgi:hypothetical protein